MALKDVSVSVESSGYDLMEALVSVVAAVKAGGGAEGALTAALAQVTTIVAAIEALPADVKADVWAFAKGVNLAAYDIVGAALGTSTQ